MNLTPRTQWLSALSRKPTLRDQSSLTPCTTAETSHGTPSHLKIPPTLTPAGTQPCLPATASGKQRLQGSNSCRAGRKRMNWCLSLNLPRMPGRPTVLCQQLPNTRANLGVQRGRAQRRGKDHAQTPGTASCVPIRNQTGRWFPPATTSNTLCPSTHLDCTTPSVNSVYLSKTVRGQVKRLRSIFQDWDSQVCLEVGAWGSKSKYLQRLESRVINSK